MSAPVSVQLRCHRGHEVASFSLWDEGPDAGRPGSMYSRFWPNGLPSVALNPRLLAAVTPVPVWRTTPSGLRLRDGSRWKVTCPACGAVSTVFLAVLIRDALVEIRAGRRAEVRLP